MGTESGAGTGTGTEREWGWRRTEERKTGPRTGAGTKVETRGRIQDGNGDGSWDRNESTSGDGNGDGDGNGNEDRIGEGGREAKKRKKPHKSCRSHVGNGGDLGGRRETCRKERVGPVAANQENLENDKASQMSTSTKTAYQLLLLIHHRYTSLKDKRIPVKKHLFNERTKYFLMIRNSWHVV